MNYWPRRRLQRGQQFHHLKHNRVAIHCAHKLVSNMGIYKWETSPRLTNRVFRRLSQRKRDISLPLPSLPLPPTSPATQHLHLNHGYKHNYDSKNAGAFQFHITGLLFQPHSRASRSRPSLRDSPSNLALDIPPSNHLPPYHLTRHSKERLVDFPDGLQRCSNLNDESEIGGRIEVRLEITVGLIKI